MASNGRMKPSGRRCRSVLIEMRDQSVASGRPAVGVKRAIDGVIAHERRRERAVLLTP
jgi:hypothetical protein